jgi:hypothetical protein
LQENNKSLQCVVIVENMSHVPKNLVELAEPFVFELSKRADFDSFQRSHAEKSALQELDSMAEDLALDGKDYHVVAGRSWSIPRSFRVEEEVHLGNYYGVEFWGTFCSHAIVKINGLYGREDVRALCLTFDDVLMLPGLDKVPADRAVHVPVLAVDDIIPTD